jgi:UDP-3-O-[3-hydroxymyristoyl] N-acetylglucosamine deacetylase
LAAEITLEGTGLHTGAPVRVCLRACDEPAVRLETQGHSARIDELEVVSTARATTVQPRHGGPKVGTVEHAFAAFAGLGVRSGVAIFVDGPELPLLDGTARPWCDALAQLSPPRQAPKLRVLRPYAIDVGPSRYEFAPGDGVDVEVVLQLDDPRLATTARWSGDPDDFVTRIAPARTFAMLEEVEQLLRRGLARHVDPGSVVLIAPDAIHHSGKPFFPDEPARHKLLDLLGDLYLKGGPPVGRIVAHRPGHAANARALARAIEDGALAIS